MQSTRLVAYSAPLAPPLEQAESPTAAIIRPQNKRGVEKFFHGGSIRIVPKLMQSIPKKEINSQVISYEEVGIYGVPICC